MILRHVLIGSFFTVLGGVSLFLPAIPFICIGALIWGPIEMVIGLVGTEGLRRATLSPPPEVPAHRPDVGSSMRICPSCGAEVETFRLFCFKCSARLP